MQAHPSSRARRRREPSTNANRPTHRPRRDAASRERGHAATTEATRARHSSLRRVSDRKSIAAVCIWCGFEPPTRARAATALRSLPAVWVSALQNADPVVHERATQLRDELHAVANRVGRLLEAPGAQLPPVRIQAPTAPSRAMPGELRSALIQVEVDRLADLVDGLSPTDWRLTGMIGDAPVTIGELIAAPLHSSHHLLAYTAARATLESTELAAPDVRVEPEPSLVR